VLFRSSAARSLCGWHRYSVHWGAKGFKYLTSAHARLTTLPRIAVPTPHMTVDCVRNVMAHTQKPDSFFRRNGRVHLNRRGASVQSTTSSRGVHIRGSNAGNTMFRGSVKGTGYPLQSPVSPSIPLPCVTVCRHISTGVYCFVQCQSPVPIGWTLRFVSLLPCLWLSCSWNSTRGRRWRNTVSNIPREI
jgi:hypothetical protein